MAATIKTDWRKAGFEVAAIVFAVLLALWLEGWREDVEEQQRADAFLERIRIEVGQNRDNLRETISEHAGYIEGLQAALDANEYDIEQVGPFLQIEGSATSFASWQSAQMSRSISRFEPETMARLAALYDTQSYYVDYLAFFFRSYTELTTAIQEGQDARMAVLKFHRHLSITNSLAEQLLSRYDAFLDGPAED